MRAYLQSTRELSFDIGRRADSGRIENVEVCAHGTLCVGRADARRIPFSPPWRRALPVGALMPKRWLTGSMQIISSGSMEGRPAWRFSAG